VKVLFEVIHIAQDNQKLLIAGENQIIVLDLGNLQYEVYEIEGQPISLSLSEWH